MTQSASLPRQFTPEAGALQNAIFNSANFSSIATDAKGVIQIFNVGAERMLGYTAAEVMNTITPADISDPQEVIARAKALSIELGTQITPGFEALVFKASRGIEDIYELTYIRKDGTRFPAVVSVTALRDAQTSIIGYLLIGTDNTARQQADDKLRTASQYARSLIEASLDPLVTISPEGKITDVNAGSIKVTGVSRERLIGTDFSNYFTEPEKAREGYQQVFAQGFVTDYPLTIRHEDGRLTNVLYNASVYKDVQGNVLGVFAAARDITARMQAEAALLKAGALQSAIFNSANFSSIATDAKGVIQIFNVGAERMLGYTAVEVMNKITPADVSDPGELIARAKALSVELGTTITPGFEALVFKASRGIEDIYELTYIRKDRSRVPAVVSVTALRDESEVIIGYLLIGTDNTARKQIEEERTKLEQTLKQKNVELEDASRMKSEFLANMSHELRTPLNAIIGFSEVLRDGLMGPMPEKQRAFIGNIFSSGQHLLALINDILDLSKVEAGKMELDLELVPVSSLLGNSLSIINEKAASRRIRLGIDISDDLGLVEVDARKVKQIAYNLLSNAVKFTPEGGSVTLRASRVEHESVGKSDGTRAGLRSFTLPESDFAHFLRISVTDSGIGISPEALAKLFKPFSQIDTGLARRFEGTGLGLAMVKLLAELHGGTVAVESTVGTGSCFTVWLPFRAPGESVGAAVRAAPATPELVTGVRTALVVESDPKSAQLIRVQLEAEGFKVVHAESAHAAMELAGRQPLALITLDVLLPTTDGWALLAQIKDSPSLQRVPVVIISILVDRNRGFVFGASAIIQKPISRQELSDLLSDLGLAARGKGQAVRVLVVDDDPKSVELIALHLSAMGSTVLRAFGGVEAIAIARKELPDVIVLDLMMPGANGFDVVEAMRTSPQTARIPIVVVTSKDVTAADRALLNGYVTIILKKTPFDQQRFASEIRRATNSHPSQP